MSAVVGVSLSETRSSQQVSGQQLWAHQQPEVVAQSMAHIETNVRKVSPAPSRSHDIVKEGDDDDLDEEAELRQCALEANVVSARKRAVEDRAEGAPIADENDHIIAISDGSDDDDTANTVREIIPALSPADRFQNALVSLREHVGPGVCEETAKESLRETMEARDTSIL